MDARTLTPAERDLMKHVQMFGSAGYPIRKLGSGWTWGTDAVKGPPKVFKTKRAAVASFELFQSVMRELLGAEAFARAVADLKARGLSDEEISAKVEAARAYEAQTA